MLTKQHNSSLVTRSPIFYGWVVWIVATLGIIATAPGQSFTISLFFDRFIEDFQLNRTTVSSLYGVGTFLASLSLTWVGRKIDVYGNRMVGAVIAALFAVVLLAFSQVRGPVTLFLAFYAVRTLGQGSLMLVSSTVIAQWFWRYRGTVMSLSLVTFALFQAVFVPGLQRVLEIYDWHQVWMMLGISVGVIVLPLHVLLVRNRPEEYGLLPDGASAKSGVSAFIEDNWTLTEARRTPIFWLFLMGRVVSPAWGTGLILHQISIFEGLGYAPEVATTTFAKIALITAAVSLVSGYLVDRHRPQRIMALQLISLVVTMCLAMVMTQAWMLNIYAAAFGFVMGNGRVFDGAVWANVFGRLHLGAIRGFATTVTVIGSALGPIVYGLSFDLTGGYDAVLWVGIVLTLIPIIGSFFVDAPRRGEAVTVGK